MEDLTHTVSITFTPRILKSANRRFWQRTFAQKLLFITCALVVLAIYLVLSGDRSWLLGAVGTAIAMIAASVVGADRLLVGRAMRRRSLLNSNAVIFTFSPDGMQTESDLGASKVPWNQFERCWKYPDMWMLFYASNAFVTLPCEQLDEMSQSFIIEQLERVGAKLQ